MSSVVQILEARRRDRWQTQGARILQKWMTPAFRVCGVSVRGHQSISTVAVEPAGRRLLSCDLSGVVNIHDLENGTGMRNLKVLQSARAPGVSLAEWYPQDGGMFITTADAAVKVWDAENFRVALQVQMIDSVQAVAVSVVQAGIVATGLSTGDIQLIDLNTGSSAHVLGRHAGAVLALAWSPTDPNTLVTGSLDSTARVWDIRRGQRELFCLDRNYSRDPPPLPDYKARPGANPGLSEGAWKNTMSTYQLFWNDEEENATDAYSNPRPGLQSAHRGGVRGLTFLPSGLLASHGCDGAVSVWYPTSGRLQRDFPLAPFAAQAPAKLAATDHGIFWQMGANIRYCDYDNYQATLSSHMNNVTCLSYNRHSTELISGGADGLVLAWRFPEGVRGPLSKQCLGWDAEDEATWSDVEVPSKRPRPDEESPEVDVHEGVNSSTV